jgi:CHAT domain-containing protein/Tfp pilus assembly protein PilF
MRKVFLSSFLFIIISLLSGSAFGGNQDEAERVWELGEKAYNESRYEEAFTYYKKSLSMCADNLECVAANLNGIGASYEALGDDLKALQYYEEALRTARKIGNNDLIATNLFNAGAIYYEKGINYEKAYHYLDESRRLFTGLNDEDSLGIVLHKLGKAASAIGKYETAVSCFNESNKINRRQNNVQAVAANLVLIGNAYSKLGQYDKPLSYYQEALSINKKLQNHRETATALRNIGDAFADLMQFDRAIPYYEDALSTQKRQNLRFDMAMTLNNMGTLFSDINEREKALNYYKDALIIAEALKDNALLPVILSNMGHRYSDQGEFDKAFSHFDQALNLEKRPGQKAIVLNNIGMIYFKLGDYEQALRYLSEALAIERTLNNFHDIAARLNNIGAVYLRQKNYREAEKLFLERKRLQAGIAATRLIHAGLIQTYIDLKRYDDALAMLQETPPSWRDNRVRHMEYHAQYGQALRGKGMLAEAALEFLKAVTIIEDMRYRVSDRTGFFAGGGYISRTDPYRHTVSDLCEMSQKGSPIPHELKPYGSNSASAAFYFSELTKARTLLEAMAESAKMRQGAEIPGYLKNREDDLLAQLAYLDGRWEKNLKRGEAFVKAVSEQRNKIKGELDTLIDELRKQYPRYAALHYPAPVYPEKLPLKDDEVLLEYAVTDEAGYLFIIKNGGIKRLITLPVTREALEEDIKAFVEPMNAKRSDGFSVRDAKKLYELLLLEALEDIQKEKIIIVPDGILGLLPFEALVIKEGNSIRDSLYVGDRYTINYYQSATILAFQRVLQKPAPENVLFALGNPVYSSNDPRYIAWKQKKTVLLPETPDEYSFRGLAVKAKWGKVTKEDKGNDIVFAPLPETEIEVRAIASIMNVNPEPPQALLSVMANETNLKKANLEEYGYLHFATHAALPGMVQGIHEPFILLGQVENQGDDDGFLTLSEALGIHLKADMVVLSACVTGLGREVEGEGVVNFARAFQQAGAESVVVSLWEVASEPAVEYMKIYYSHLKAGKNRAEALRLARNAIKARYPDPFYWAVFILHGEG